MSDGVRFGNVNTEPVRASIDKTSVHGRLIYAYSKHFTDLISSCCLSLPPLSCSPALKLVHTWSLSFTVAFTFSTSSYSYLKQEQEVVANALRRCPVKAYKPPKRVCTNDSGLCTIHAQVYSSDQVCCVKHRMLASCRRIPTVKRSVQFAWRSTRLKSL